MESSTRELVSQMFDDIVNSNDEGAAENFKAALSVKVADALVDRKQEIARGMYGEEDPAEYEEDGEEHQDIESEPEEQQEPEEE